MAESPRRVFATRDDGEVVTKVDDAQQELLALYDEALPEVYGYVRRRVDSDFTAEDITADTFLGAVDTLNKGVIADVTVKWLIGIARHKVADHWRGTSRRAAKAERLESQPTVQVDTWDVVLDAQLAHSTLTVLSTAHRAALSLRYLDGLPVGAVASHLGRTPGATEALLTRAKAAFRDAYPSEGAGNV